MAHLWEPYLPGNEHWAKMPLFSSQETSWLSSPVPLSNDERPCMCVTCASWETSPRLVWTWPSSIYMVDLDLSKSCLHWWCLDETVCFLQWEHLVLTLYSLHWDMETRVQAWPGLCLGNSMPASEHQCSNVWALGLGWASLGTVLKRDKNESECQEKSGLRGVGHNRGKGKSLKGSCNRTGKR